MDMVTISGYFLDLQGAAKQPAREPAPAALDDALDLLGQAVALALQVWAHRHDPEYQQHAAEKARQAGLVISPSPDEREQHQQHLQEIRGRLVSERWLRERNGCLPGQPQVYDAATATAEDYRRHREQLGRITELKRMVAALSPADREELRLVHPKFLAEVEYEMRRRASR
jgi:hypothetical protein